MRKRQLKKLQHLQRGLSPLLIKPWRKVPFRKLLLTTHQQRRLLSKKRQSRRLWVKRLLWKNLTLKKPKK